MTYSLLHANFSHIAFNVLWLLPFGSALARRFGGVRFFLFMAVTAIAGALAHLVTHEHAVAPMIGASASVSGAMAAAIRFAFVKGSFLSFSRGDADAAAKVPALSLARALAQPARAWLSRRLVRRQHHLRRRVRSRSEPKASALPGRRISADFSPVSCCFRCSIRCRGALRMLRMRHRKMHRASPDRRLRRKPDFIHHRCAIRQGVSLRMCLCRTCRTRRNQTGAELLIEDSRNKDRARSRARPASGETTMTVRAILNSKGHHIESVEPDAKLSAAIKILSRTKNRRRTGDEQRPY